MPFSDFKNIEQVVQKYPLKIRQEHFLPDIDLQLPETFTENLIFLLDKKAVDESEAFLSEAFIFPFLQHTWKRHSKLKLWSHRALVCDDKLFSSWAMVREWGQIGQPCTVWEMGFASKHAAVTASVSLRRRRERQGYALVPSGLKTEDSRC